MGTRCQSCGAQICWMKTTAGKAMPADMAPSAGRYTGAGGTKCTIIAEGGQVIIDGLEPSSPFPLAPEYVQVRDPKTGALYHGRIPHWATCTDPGPHRRSKR